MILGSGFMIALLTWVSCSYPSGSVSPSSTKEIQPSRPSFSMLSEKTTYLLYEPIALRFVIENPKAEAIYTNVGIIGDPIEHMSTIGVRLNGPDKNLEVIQNRSIFGELPMGLMAPHERLSRDYLLACKVSSAGDYSASAYYVWRASGKEKLSYVDRRVNSNEVIVRIIEPTSYDKDALSFVGDERLLMAIQDADGLLWVEKLEEIKDLREQYLAKYPKSIYSRNVLHAMAENQRRDGQYNKAIENFNKYVAQYPESWFIDDALYATAECQIELKQYDEALKIINKLQNLQTDAKIQKATARLKSGLDKGLKSLGQIFGH